MRLGEALVQKGFITEAQLQEALKAQLIYGGHLGTCLIEFGFVKESQLGRVLAEISSTAMMFFGSIMATCSFFSFSPNGMTWHRSTTFRGMVRITFPGMSWNISTEA